MAIPYNDNLRWDFFTSNPDWHKNLPASRSNDNKSQVNRALTELFALTFKEPVVRGIQFVRDTARLVLKVPIRAIWTPIILEKNWKELERAKINTKLVGYSFAQLVSVPAKFLVALAALVTSAISETRAQWLLDKSEKWTAHLDGRASQLEALKEEGAKKAPTRAEYNEYKRRLYTIDPKSCRKNS